MGTGDLKCHRCAVCDGYGCPGMLPGLGGVFEGKNFQLNCEGWKELYNTKKEEISKITVSPAQLRCGPVTGAVENIGYANEADFYLPYLKNAAQAGFGLCVGDGCPDEKLKLGVAAVKELNTEVPEQSRKIDAAFFLKPYPQERLFERIEWVRPYASHIGIDIDSYNIVTMRNLVNLERKTAVQLEEFREHTKLPFVIKGIFTDDDIALVREVRPDVVYISNHGGRVETRIGSTAQFLKEHAVELKKYCKEIWVDGGIRTREDIQTALYFGADQIIMARPLIRATYDDHYNETVKELIN
ncbi:FMN-dependent dehydrogenase, includes L-lactate dehydrogenase and type II isopentenyl diphosphate isomerase [Treponema bryantii]|uniref:FMN-dependent dehydrogenase, includes L-lactate dehydrogenase and type II isopentenyl diphosphate isomerase n=1 Tax=Treponema bryantii TaxID=163 RepID=A0A1H9GK99_9SPIR|nr:alpha-hydroxy-acid oxidizing protein [Treponema bryantii]SEQ50454.1 FMN-dependent dehydrogenase, includes L-lactate dehydrogenase and type II isopentenyl diphosphate isomerase [Treponema bryantii]